MSDFISVAKIGDVPPGEGRIVDAAGTPVALFHIDGEFFALDNTCIHKGGPLGDGACEGVSVSCPWHGWVYDVKTGACANSPGESVTTYEVRVEADNLLVKV